MTAREGALSPVLLGLGQQQNGRNRADEDDDGADDGSQVDEAVLELGHDGAEDTVEGVTRQARSDRPCYKPGPFRVRTEATA